MLIKVEIASFALETTQNIPLIIVKEAHGTRTLPIVIGTSDAGSIAIKSLNIVSGRPLTIDLMHHVIRELGGRVDKVVIHEVIDQVYYAHIYITQGKAIRIIDCRPSDALSLAMRCDLPIFVEDHLFEKVGAFQGLTEKEKLREHIASMDTVNFGSYYL